MKFSRVTVYPAFSKEILIEWELERATLPGVYWFLVERAGSPEGPWELLTPTPLPNAEFFIDRTAPLLSKENFLFYRVTVTDPKGRVFISDPKDLFRNLEREQWYVAREITRKEILRFVKKVGVRAAVLKKKRFGPLCDCVDPVSGEVTDSSCPDCFGTRYAGGFNDPIEAWVESSPFPNAKQLQNMGWLTEDFSGQIRMVSYPLVTREDIIVELDSNRRLRVLQIDPVELRTVPIVQLVGVKMIPRSDVEYTIPAYIPYQGSRLCPTGPDRDEQLAPLGKDFTTVQPDDGGDCPSQYECEPGEVC